MEQCPWLTKAPDVVDGNTRRGEEQARPHRTGGLWILFIVFWPSEVTVAEAMMNEVLESVARWRTICIGLTLNDLA
jgi:hypothetical protein